MTTSIFVMTCPRGTEPFEFLRRTVEQINDEELDDVDKRIVFDGDEESFAGARDAVDARPGDGWTWHRFAKPPGTFLGGNKLTYFHILELAAGLNRDAVVVEDDLVKCVNAYTRAVLFPVPADVAFVQFFSGFTFRSKETEPGLWRTPGTTQGTQAIKFTLRTMRRLVDWRNSDAEFGKFTGSDDALNLARRRLGLRAACHCPDIFEHAGVTSAVTEGALLEAGMTDGVPDDVLRKVHALRSSATWPGEQFDAVRLFARHELYK